MTQIIKSLNVDKYSLTVIIEDNLRNRDLDLKEISNSIKIVKVESINYSKNILNQSFKRRE